MNCPAGKVPCVHYGIDGSESFDFLCSAFGLVRKMCINNEVEACPCPDKIQAPKKDPMEELANEMTKYVYGEGANKIINKQFLEIIKKRWPKKGDAHKVWLAMGGSSAGMMVGQKEETFKEHLKTGGFEV